MFYTSRTNTVDNNTKENFSLKIMIITEIIHVCVYETAEIRHMTTQNASHGGFYNKHSNNNNKDYNNNTCVCKEGEKVH